MSKINLVVWDIEPIEFKVAHKVLSPDDVFCATLQMGFRYGDGEGYDYYSLRIVTIPHLIKYNYHGPMHYTYLVLNEVKICDIVESIEEFLSNLPVGSMLECSEILSRFFHSEHSDNLLSDLDDHLILKGV